MRSLCHTGRRRRSAGSCAVSYDTETIEVTKTVISVDVTVDEGGATRTRRVVIDINDAPALRHFQTSVEEISQRMPQEVDEASRKPANEVDTDVKKPKKTGVKTQRVGRVVASVGAFMGIVGTVNAIESKNPKAIAETSTGLAYGSVSMVAGSKHATKLLRKAAVKTLGKSAAKKLGKALGKAIPGAGLILDAYSIVDGALSLKQAIKDNDTKAIVLSSIHLALDYYSLVFSVLSYTPLAPIVAPLDLALSIVSMSIDSFVLSIWDELGKVKGQGFWKHVGAVFVGLGKGFVNFLTGGILQQLDVHNEKLQIDHEFKETLTSMQDPKTYYKVSTDSNGIKTIDFVSGKNSMYGGFLDFELTGYGYGDLRLDGVLGPNGRSADVVTGRVNDANIRNIVMGIGGSVAAKFERSKVKLWGFIPIKDRELIAELTEVDGRSYLGRYTGNDRDNVFSTMQGNVTDDQQRRCDVKLKSYDDFSVRLESYRYFVYGKGGNDVFLIHHQQSFLKGGRGADTYVLQAYTKSTVIDNFSVDDDLDVLRLNVTYDDVTCSRQHNNLVIGFCDSRKVTLKNYFGEPVYYKQHLRFLTDDGG